MAIKLSYIPERGMTTNYEDCEAIAPDGSRWQSASNRWSKISDAPAKKWEAPRNSAAPLFAVFGFFVSMALFSKPVFMSFTEPVVAVPVLLGICCASAAAFYRVSR
jgi:hypothetical protein